LSNFDRYITEESRWAAKKAFLISCINIAAPIKTMQVKTKNLVPWFDKDLVILSKKRNRLYNKAISSKLDNDWLNFKNIRQSFSHLFRLKKSTFYKNILRNESTSSSKHWRELDPYFNPNKITKVSPSLIINDTYFYTPKDIAMTFSNFFSSVTNNSVPVFNFVKFSAVEVHKALLSLRSSSAAGFVGIETRVFKECASELKDCLTDLFNLCLSTGSIPDD
jgi:hypothetical protein